MCFHFFVFLEIGLTRNFSTLEMSKIENPVIFRDYDLTKLDYLSFKSGHFCNF